MQSIWNTVADHVSRNWEAYSAALGALALAPFAAYAHMIPLAALAGVLFFVAARLIKIHEYRAIWRSSRLEFALTAISLLGVVLMLILAMLAWLVRPYLPRIEPYIEAQAREQAIESFPADLAAEIELAEQTASAE